MINVEWSEEDEAYVAKDDEWPWVSGIGFTENNAKGHLRVAIKAIEDSITATVTKLTPTF